MRKVTAVVFSLLMTMAATAVLVGPAGAQNYPPSSTTTSPPPTSTPPTTVKPPPTSTPPTSASPTSIPATVTTAAAQSSNLAFTGSDSTPLVLIGVIAVTLGAILVVGARRRRSVQPPKAG